LQVAGRKGGDAPKVEKIVKEGHCALTLAGPAVGPMLPPLWTFAGSESRKNMCKGAPGARWNKTHNGWPDIETSRLFSEMLVEWKNEQKLDRVLLLTDNADIAIDPLIANLFKQNNIEHFGLIPSATGKMQPLDVGLFDQITVKLKKKVQHEDLILCYDNIAGAVHDVLEELQVDARKRSSPSLLSRGFRESGIWPFNPGVFSDKDFAASDLRLGLHADHPQVTAAKERGKMYAEHAVQAAIAEATDGTLERFKRAAERVEKEREKAFREAKKPFNPAWFAQRQHYTSDSFLAAEEKKAAEDAAEEARLAKGRAERDAATKARGGLSKKEWDKEQSKIRAEATAAKKAAEQLEAAAKRQAAEAVAAAAPAKVPKKPATAAAPSRKAVKRPLKADEGAAAGAFKPAKRARM
jgi:hypothetical protein